MKDFFPRRVRIIVQSTASSALIIPNIFVSLSQQTNTSQESEHKPQPPVVVFREQHMNRIISSCFRRRQCGMFITLNRDRFPLFTNVSDGRRAQLTRTEICSVIGSGELRRILVQILSWRCRMGLVFVSIKKRLRQCPLIAGWFFKASLYVSLMPNQFNSDTCSK